MSSTAHLTLPSFRHALGQPATAPRMPTSTRLPFWTRSTLLTAVVLVAAASSAWAQPFDGGAGDDIPGIPSRSMLEIVQAGGLLMIPILFCSVLTLVFVFERLIVLRHGRVIPGPFVKRLFHQLGQGQLDREQAIELCEQNRSPVAGVLAAGLRKWGRPGVEVEQAVLDAGERAVTTLRRHLRVFNGVATITPLLGLLGTVVGMIKAFNDIATSDAMGRPELLASGISEALITTAAGLTVAIPSLVCYLFFTSRVDKLIIEIDAHGQELVRLICQETMVAPGNRGAARSKSRDAA